MNPNCERFSAPDESPAPRPRYEKPEIQRVDLALAETLSEGCKLETDGGCVGPPVVAYEGGS